MTEDPSQTNATPPADSSLAAGIPVTAGAQAPDNATPPSNQETAPLVVVGSTGEVVDDSGKSYAERKQALLSRPAATAEPPAPEPEPQTAPAAAAPNPTPASAAVPPTDEDDVPLIGSDGRLPKMRVRTVTPVDVQAIAEFQASQKAGNTESFVEFVQKRFPAAPAQAAEPGANPAAGPTAPAAAAAETPEAVDAQLKELKQQRYQAMEDFDFTKAAQIEEQEEALRAKRETLGLAALEQQTVAQQEHEKQVTGYLGKAAQMFPQAVKADDPLVLKAGEVLQGWIDGNDPRAGHPSAYLYSYVEAAAELGIAPSGAPAASSPTPSSPTSPVHRAPITAIIAGGNASSTQTRAPADTRTYEEKKAAYLAQTAQKVA